MRYISRLLLLEYTVVNASEANNAANVEVLEFELSGKVGVGYLPVEWHFGGYVVLVYGMQAARV